MPFINYSIYFHISLKAFTLDQCNLLHFFVWGYQHQFAVLRNFNKTTFWAGLQSSSKSCWVWEPLWRCWLCHSQWWLTQNKVPCWNLIAAYVFVYETKPKIKPPQRMLGVIISHCSDYRKFKLNDRFKWVSLNHKKEHNSLLKGSVFCSCLNQLNIEVLKIIFQGKTFNILTVSLFSCCQVLEMLKSLFKTASHFH